MKTAHHRDVTGRRSEAAAPLDPSGASTSYAEPDARAPRAAAETAEAIAESGGTRMPADDELPTAENFPFAPHPHPGDGAAGRPARAAAAQTAPARDAAPHRLPRHRGDRTAAGGA